MNKYIKKLVESIFDDEEEFGDIDNISTDEIIQSGENKMRIAAATIFEDIINSSDSGHQVIVENDTILVYYGKEQYKSILDYLGNANGEIKNLNLSNDAAVKLIDTLKLYKIKTILNKIHIHGKQYASYQSPFSRIAEVYNSLELNDIDINCINFSVNGFTLNNVNVSTDINVFNTKYQSLLSKVYNKVEYGENISNFIKIEKCLIKNNCNFSTNYMHIEESKVESNMEFLKKCNSLSIDIHSSLSLINDFTGLLDNMLINYNIKRINEFKKDLEKQEWINIKNIGGITFNNINPNVRMFDFYSGIDPRITLNNITFEGLSFSSLKKCKFRIDNFHKFIGGRMLLSKYVLLFGQFKESVKNSEITIQYGDTGNPGKLMKELELNLNIQDYYISFYQPGVKKAWYNRTDEYQGVINQDYEEEKIKKLKEKEDRNILNDKIIDETLKLMNTQDPNDIIHNLDKIKGLFHTKRKKLLDTVIQTPIFLCKHKKKNNKYVEDDTYVIYIKKIIPETTGLSIDGFKFDGKDAQYIWNIYTSGLLSNLTAKQIYTKIYDAGINFTYMINSKMEFCNNVKKYNLLPYITDDTASKPTLVSSKKLIKKDVLKTTNSLSIVDYSAKAIVVLGDSINMADEFKKLGGHWNKFLTINGKKEKGWVFPKSKEDKVKELIK